ncbi:MAG: N-acetylglucosamine-6-phosphate deacetylase, partial [Lachnospiraceae bacterium]|nr:N-acetylglucosamine-6-phosphate deacetylase [Lachnospiraceae bacterium]
MIIKNASVYTENGIFQTKDIYIDGDHFAEHEEQVHNTQVIDASGCYAIPGLTDIHFHGCAGKDFCDGTVESIRTMEEYELYQGIMSICPATMTIPASQIAGICQVA